MLVLGLCGSLRSDSHNRRLLAAARLALPPGIEFDEWSQLGGVPPYNSDIDVAPGSAVVEDMRAAIARADAVLIATPEYNHSIPGQLKNVLDCASRPFPGNSLRSMPVAVVGASSGMFGAVWAQAETRKILDATGAHVIDAELAVGHADQAFAPDGTLHDPALQERLVDIVAQLVCAARPAQAQAA